MQFLLTNKLFATKPQIVIAKPPASIMQDDAVHPVQSKKRVAEGSFSSSSMEKQLTLNEKEKIEKSANKKYKEADDDLAKKSAPLSVKQANIEVSLSSDISKDIELMSDIEDEKLSPQKDHKSVLVKKQMSEEEKCEIGRLGERRALEFYSKKYIKRFGENSIKLMNEGFKVTGTSKKGKYKEIEYIWKNVQHNTTAPIDVIIRSKCNGVQQLDKFVEIKATKEKSDSPAHISRNQLKAMRKHGSQFLLFRAYDVKNTAPDSNNKDREIKNPFETILGKPFLVKRLESIKIKI